MKEIFVDDTVSFIGTKIYPTPNAAVGIEHAKGDAKVIALGHPKFNSHIYFLKWEDGSIGWADMEDVNVDEAEENKTGEHSVIVIDELEPRNGPGNVYRKTGDKIAAGETHKIAEVRDGKGSESGWGKLATGEGWIPLDKVEMI